MLKGGGGMKAITIRGVEPSLLDKLKQEAKRHEKSLNQFVVDMLKENFGMKKKKRYTIVHHDLDHLFGKWKEKEFERIQGKIDMERKIDKELWK